MKKKNLLSFEQFRIERKVTHVRGSSVCGSIKWKCFSYIQKLLLHLNSGFLNFLGFESYK